MDSFWSDKMAELVKRWEEPAEVIGWNYWRVESWKRQQYRAGLGMRPIPAREVGWLRRGVHCCGRDARRWKRRRFIQRLRKQLKGA